MKAILLLLLISLSSLANSICTSDIEALPTLNRGRVKPLFVLAKDSIKFMANKTTLDGKSSLEIFCRLSLDEEFKKTFDIPFYIEHLDTKKFLEMDEKESMIASSKVIEKKFEIRAKMASIKEKNGLKKGLTKLLNRITVLEAIKNQNIWTVASVENGELNWLSLSHFKDIDLAKLQDSEKQYISVKGDTYKLELQYFQNHPFTIAMLIALIGIMLTVVLKSNKLGVLFALMTIGVEIYAITLRVMISGRAPITNMYETVMFSGFGALIISLLIMLVKKDKLFLIAGLGYNILCLFMMKFANGMLEESISPLVPVLRDNFWLSTHVSTIILSYAALALSWIIANIILIKSRFFSISKKDYRYYESLANTCIAVGITLLGAGIILGGIWADYSWGRFWGWDPKETWSLIVLLFYMAILHGKYTNWLNPHRFVLAAAAGFMTVMMAWFGVNYILASGLHSYGFSEGGAIFLGTFFAIQTALIIICAKPKKA